MKIWADKWRCTGEVKGSTIPLNFKRLYITSNYSIEELFPEDQEMQLAIRRRFKVVHMAAWLGAEIGCSAGISAEGAGGDPSPD